MADYAQQFDLDEPLRRSGELQKLGKTRRFRLAPDALEYSAGLKYGFTTRTIALGPGSVASADGSTIVLTDSRKGRVWRLSAGDTAAATSWVHDILATTAARPQPAAGQQQPEGEAQEQTVEWGEGGSQNGSQPQAEDGQGTELRLNPWWDAALQEKHEYLRLRHRVWSLARARTSCCCGMSPVAG